MEPITIRRADFNELTLVQQIGRETFIETFAQENTEADLQTYLSENFSDTNLSAELNNRNSRFFIAREGEALVGYLKVNMGQTQTELQDENGLEIERIYVKSAYHGKKIGQLLYEKALEIARQQNKSYIWLGVWEKNTKAIRFYEKNGFVAFDTHIFKFGDDLQTDIMMKKDV